MRIFLPTNSPTATFDTSCTRAGSSESSASRFASASFPSGSATMCPLHRSAFSAQLDELVQLRNRSARLVQSVIAALRMGEEVLRIVSLDVGAVIGIGRGFGRELSIGSRRVDYSCMKLLSPVRSTGRVDSA